MYTYGPLIAKNARSGRLLGGAPVQVTALDGTPLTTAPAGLVTNPEGYLPAFTADTDQRVILARPRGGDPLPLYAHEGLQDAAEAADTINTGRLSEDALESTIAAGVSAGLGDLDGADTGAAGLAVLAASLPAEAREVLGITVDTSVGTRVFIGGVMVYGDTGWRVTDGPTIGANITAGTIRWRRIGNQVHAFLVGVTLAAYNASILSSGEIPNGFRADPNTRLTQGIGESNDALSEHHIAIYSALRYSKTITTTGMHTNGPATDLQGHLSWPAAYDHWPTTLPGIPG